MTIRSLIAQLTARPEIGLGVALGLGALAGSGAIPIPSFRIPTTAPAAPPAAAPARPAGQATTAAAPLVDPSASY